MITTPNMKLCLALVAAFLIQGSTAARRGGKDSTASAEAALNAAIRRQHKYDYSAVAKIDATEEEEKNGVPDYTLDLGTLEIRIPNEEDNKITALEFEICRKTGYAHRLGTGSFGGVFAGRLTKRGAKPFRVAIKLGGEEKDCYNESIVMQRLDHPAINKIHAFGFLPPLATDKSIQKRQVVVMELVKGRSVESYITKDEKNMAIAQELPQETRISIVHQVANALEYMYDQQYIHGDIADRNIMVTQSDGIYNVVLIDFGATVTFEDVRGAGTGVVPINDLHTLGRLCTDLQLKDHAKVWPVFCQHPYVYGMDRYPERVSKHLRPSEGHPATEFLPGLLGYDTYCQEQKRIINETIPKLEAQIRELETQPKKRGTKRRSKARGRIAAKILKDLKKQLKEYTLRTRTFYDRVIRVEAPTSASEENTQPDQSHVQPAVPAQETAPSTAVTLLQKPSGPEPSMGRWKMLLKITKNEPKIRSDMELAGIDKYWIESLFAPPQASPAMPAQEVSPPTPAPQKPSGPEPNTMGTWRRLKRVRVPEEAIRNRMADAGIDQYWIDDLFKSTRR